MIYPFGRPENPLSGFEYFYSQDEIKILEKSRKEYLNKVSGWMTNPYIAMSPQTLKNLKHTASLLDINFSRFSLTTPRGEMV